MAQIGVKLGIDGEAEYRKQLQNIIQSTKTLDKQLDALESSFDGQTKSMEQNAAETELLQKKAELLNREVEEMQRMVDAAAEKFGENSTECQKWEASLATAETELNKTNAELEAHEQYAEDASSALGQLTAEIESQTAELDSLRDQYVNAVLEFGDTSDEAQNLAAQISALSGELNANQAALDNANASADALTGSLEQTSAQASGVGSAMMDAAGQFVPGMNMIASVAAGAGVADILSGIINLAVEVGTQIYETSLEWQQALYDMEIATGLTGDELSELYDKSVELYASFMDADTEFGVTTNAMSMLQTRLGMTAEETQQLSEYFLAYADICKTDANGAINDVVDMMKQYGLVTNDSNQNIQTAISIMDALTQAQSDADVSVDQLANEITKQAGAFQNLGMSYDEAIAMMVAYRDAGGQTSDISMALQNVVKNLSGETDDLGGAWNEIMTILSTSTDPFQTLSTEIGNTGKTIEDVFGAKKAQAMINTFTNGSINVDRFTASIRNSGGRVAQYFNDSRTFADKMDWAIKQTTSSMTTADLNISGAWKNIIKFIDNTQEAFTKDSGLIETDASDMSSKVSSAASNMNTRTAGSFNSMSTNAANMASSVSNSLSGVIGTFNNSVIRLNIEAPTISYTKTGSGKDTVYTPNVNFNRYAKAYDRAIMLSSPTIFGAMNGELLVGGDRPGTEIVVGESHLMEMFTKAVRNAGGQSINVVVNGAEGQNVEELADIVIDKLQMELIGSEAAHA